MTPRPHGWLRDVELIPTGKVADALLILLSHFGRPVAPDETYGPLADKFELTHEQRTVRRETRDEPAWNNRVQTARSHLVRGGLLNDGIHGLWSLTTGGQARAKILERPPHRPEDIGL
jgi:hypothetical protein